MSRMSRQLYRTWMASNLQYPGDNLNQLRPTEPRTESQSDSAKAPAGSHDFTKGQDDLADVVLLVEGYRFHVNKAILATHSPVFRAMFTRDFQEKDKSEIPFPGKAAFPFYMMLGFLYHKEWFNIRELPEAQDLLELAREYNIDVLKRECQKFLLEKSEPSVETLLVAQEFELGAMLTRCTESLGENFSLQQLQQQPRYKEIQDKQLVAILTKQISAMNRYIEQNNSKTKKWQGEILSDIKGMLSYVPDDNYPCRIPCDNQYFDHEHTSFASGCKKCFTVLSKDIRDKSNRILSKVKNMPKT